MDDIQSSQFNGGELFMQLMTSINPFARFILEEIEKKSQVSN